MTRRVYGQIMSTVGALPAESGGVLLGPADGDDVTGFHFDVLAACSGATYSPDHITLTRKFTEEWLPYGLHLRGFVHSHPPGHDRLSDGDLVYIRRLLKANDEMERFIAPVVLPHQFRLCPIVVERDRPDQPRLTRLELI